MFKANEEQQSNNRFLVLSFTSCLFLHLKLVVIYILVCILYLFFPFVFIYIPTPIVCTHSSSI